MTADEDAPELQTADVQAAMEQQQQPQQPEAAAVASAAGTGAASLFDYTISAANYAVPDAAGVGVDDDRASATGSALFGSSLEAVALATRAMGSSSAAANVNVSLEEKKTGRPSHPAWEHFVRGEKRNRFHHHAFCRYCTAHGADPMPVRGVSGNMIRHLQKCVYCPPEIVTQLRVLCAQKDAVSFNKRHNQSSSATSDMELLMHDTPSLSSVVASNKRARRNDGSASSASVHSLSEVAGVPVAHGTGEEEFMPLNLPILHSDNENNLVSQHATNNGFHSGKPSIVISAYKPPATAGATRTPTSAKNVRAREASSSRLSKTAAVVRGSQHATSPATHHQQESADLESLNRMVATATLSASLPWGWMCTGETASLFGDAHSNLDWAAQLAMLPSIGAAFQDKQIAHMREEPVGVTLAINAWTSKYHKSSMVLLSLVNAVGEASAWELLDMGLKKWTPEDLAAKIKIHLAALDEQGIQVISIVADTVDSYAAARYALIGGGAHEHHATPVLPCFSHFLSVLLGVILTVSDEYMETMGNVIELVQAFSNHHVLSVLRRECGDSEAALVIPNKNNWYSFIECIDSVRQYEDMIKIIATKVLAASGAAISTLPTRKDSSGNSMDDFAETALAASVLRTIQSQEFWENVVSLSELMAPIKETHKIMSGQSVPSFSLSDTFYQLGRMHQQYGEIISDWEDNTCGRRTMEHVRFLQRTINKMWRLYDQPLVFLSYIFNYNVVDPHVTRNHPSLQWLTIGKYAKEYFRRWFCLPSARSSSSSNSSNARIAALGEESASQFLEDILAFKERKYPFDADSVCEFENPRSFFMLISDSNPLMHLFGSRLFSFVPVAPTLSDVFVGKHFIPSATAMAEPRDVLYPMLQMNLFECSKVRPSKESLQLVHHSKHKSNSAPLNTLNWGGMDLESSVMECGMDLRARATVWNKSQWSALAKEWKAHWESETDMSDLLQNLSMLEPSAFRVSPNLSLDEIFKDKLPSRLPHDREDAVVDV